MIEFIAAGGLLILGSFAALLVPQGTPRALFLLLLPLAGLAAIWSLHDGTSSPLAFADQNLILLRLDPLSRLFITIFYIAAFLAALFAWNVRDPLQQTAGALYAGTAIAAVSAGDLLTFFFFWEGTALASAALVWARRTPEALRSSMRYLCVQILSGLLLLAGLLLHQQKTGSLAFSSMQLNDAASLLIFLAFGIKAAFPFLHNWLQDAYPESTVTGAVFLSCFTTKLAIYALARGFPGTEILIYIGALMTLFPIFYAVIENDLRRVLAYSLNNQLGFMVVGVGIGTPLALNGAAAHAFCHILYKALLFMSVGAVLFRTGTAKASQLGGLYKSMPLTMICCVVGAASISAFPLFSGFISKSLILSASANNEHWIVWFVLLFASAGVFHHSGIKIPYFTFFAHDNGWRVKEAPLPMLAAMGLAALLCIGLGVYPQALYAILPFGAHYEPYETGHVLDQLQLLLFSALAFAFLMMSGVYPPEKRGINLDSDWVFRALPRRALLLALPPLAQLRAFAKNLRQHLLLKAQEILAALYHPGGRLAPTQNAGAMAIWTAVLLALIMLFAHS